MKRILALILGLLSSNTIGAMEMPRIGMLARPVYYAQ